MLKYGVKLDEKIIKTMDFKKNIFNKEGRQFRIFLLLYNAHCSLRIHHLGFDNICEDDPGFQRVFNLFKYVGIIKVFRITFFVRSFYQRSTWSPIYGDNLTLAEM
jgi:hypothetical protein